MNRTLSTLFRAFVKTSPLFISLWGSGLLLLNIWKLNVRTKWESDRVKYCPENLTGVPGGGCGNGSTAAKGAISYLEDLLGVVEHNQNLSMDFWKRNWRTTVPLDNDAKKYLEEFERTCERHDSRERIMGRRTDVTSDLPLCPCVPGLLVGPVIPDTEALLKLTWNATDTLARSVALGGYWKPSDCIARRRVAVIIPCRDRESHLRALLVHLHPILQRHLVEYRIFVVEQVWPAIYNKGTSMNVGFLEAEKMMDFDCVMFHDVDLLAEDDRAIVYCGDKARHYGAFLDKWRYNLNYTKIFGGVVVMSKEQFVKVNGFSNHYYGWGGEDDDFRNRVDAAGYAIERPAKSVSRYSSIKHSRDRGNPYNPDRFKALRKKTTDFRALGLNNVQYETSAIVLEPLLTLIKTKIKSRSHVGSIFDSMLEKTVLYFKVYGACQTNISETPFVLREESLSEISCQNGCDVDLNCKAYIYFRRRHKHCMHLGAICRIDHHVFEAITYIKEQTRTPEVRQDNLQNKLLNNLYESYTVANGDCPGNDLRGLKTTLEGCMKACDVQNTCVAFGFGKTYSIPCWLKKKTCQKYREIQEYRFYIKVRY